MICCFVVLLLHGGIHASFHIMPSLHFAALLSFAGPSHACLHPHPHTLRHAYTHTIYTNTRTNDRGFHRSTNSAGSTPSATTRWSSVAGTGKTTSSYGGPPAPLLPLLLLGGARRAQSESVGW